VKKAVFRIILPGLAAGGLCGAAVGLGLASPLVGVGAAVTVGIGIALLVARAKRSARREQDLTDAWRSDA
jgi:ABC-type uncharacterized transport system permease subunit